MSSSATTNTGWSPRSAAERILFQLKMRGEQTAARLGAALGTSGEAARQQLVRLAEEGFVESWSQASGVGRPSQFWRLTQAGQARFPDTHAALTVDLLDMVRHELGEEMLEKLIDAREAKTRAAYGAELAGAGNLAERVARLARLRSAEGYMADWAEDGEGFMLFENHCPICAAASACQKFCRAELSVFSDVLGADAQVERIEHIVAGARRCAYRIRATQSFAIIE